MAAYFYRMSGSPQYTAPSTPSFSDVPLNHPYYKEIEWMKAQGITTGWPDGTYRPEGSVNRDAMAAFFYRYAGSPEYTAPAQARFTDVPPRGAGAPRRYGGVRVPLQHGCAEGKP